MRLDSYPIVGDGANFLDKKVASVKIDSGNFSLHLDGFHLHYPLLQKTYRTVLGVLRSDDDPMSIQGLSLVWVIFTRRDSYAVPLRVGITYFRNDGGSYSASVVVDGYPVYVTSRGCPFDVGEVKKFIKSMQMMFRVL